MAALLLKSCNVHVPLAYADSLAAALVKSLARRCRRKVINLAVRFTMQHRSRGAAPVQGFAIIDYSPRPNNGLWVFDLLTELLFHEN